VEGGQEVSQAAYLAYEAMISGTDLWRKGVKFVANTGYYRGAYRYR